MYALKKTILLLYLAHSTIKSTIRARNNFLRSKKAFLPAQFMAKKNQFPKS